jgi:superkiller protein 3
MAALLSATAGANAAECAGPANLEARLKAHAGAAENTALGVWFSQNHQTDCAIGAFRAALKIDAGLKAALDGLARTELAEGDYGAVISLLEKARRDENLALDLASAYRAVDQYDDVVRVLNDGLKLYPASVGLAGALISLEIHDNKSSAAEVLAEKLARMKPNDIEAQRIYLRVLVINGAYDKARPLVGRLLALAPHDADFLDKAGYMERLAGEYPAARKHLEETVALNPNYYYSRYNLGVVLEQLHEEARAKAEFSKAIELDPSDPEPYIELAKVLRTLGETDAAQEQLKVYRQKLKYKSDKKEAVLKATQAEEAGKAGDNQKAAALFREACAALPDNAEIPYRLALVLNQLGDTAGERAALEQAIKNDPGYEQAHYQLGYLETRTLELSAAEEQFRLALKTAPKFVRAWVALAATLGMENRLHEAQEAVAQALNLEPKNAAALDLSRKLATAQGQP